LPFLFHSLVLNTLLLCGTGLFLTDRSSLLFYLPLLDRLIDEV
jgi:hypothetical protein